jgi:hypothetical protein
VNPIGHLLASNGLSGLPVAARQGLTGREFFPQLISAPFHHGLTVVFATAAGLASALRGGPLHPPGNRSPSRPGRPQTRP